VTEVTSYQGTHTYRLFKLLKNCFPTAPFLAIRLQQRGEIMKNFPNFVKHFSKSFCSTPFKLPNPTPPPCPAETAALQGGAHSIDFLNYVNTFPEIYRVLVFQRVLADSSHFGP